MNVRDKKGSITIFVLVGLLFMTGFLIISFGSNVNKSKVAEEQFNIMSSIYSHNDGDANAYERAYTDLRKKNAQLLTEFSEDSSTLELTKTFEDNLSNYKIYGNSVQDGTPSPTNPVEVESVGDLVTDETDVNYGKYKIPVKVSGTENNLLDLKQLQGITSGGSNKTSTKMIVSNNYKGIIMQCEPNTQYVLQISNTISKFRFFYYDTEPIIGTTISIGGAYYDSGTHVGSTFAKIKTPSNAKWIGIALGTNEEMENTKVWLTKGTEKVEYEEYQGETFNIYLDEPLRKVGEAADHIDFSTGKVVRKIKEVEINGEIWTTYHNSQKEDGTWRYYGFKTTINVLEAAAFRLEGLSNMSPYVGEYYSQNNAMWLGVGGGIIYWIKNDYYDASREDCGLSKLQERLNSYPLKIYYASPVDLPQEALNLPELRTYEDYTRIEVLTSITPSKIEVEYMGYTLE